MSRAAAGLVMPTRILIVGGGGREHALAWKLAAEPGVNEVIVAPGSDGIAEEARVRSLPGVDPQDPSAVVAAARSVAAELVVIGPEAPLAVGLADALGAAGVPVLGPDRAAARLESSKAFCHEVAAAAGVRMARARAFAGQERAAAVAFVRELADGGARPVLKTDGLAGGKGVIVCDDPDDAVRLVPAFLSGAVSDGPALVIEERVAGREASVIALCDGRRAIALPAARDHKRLADGDTGPNTGGMGAYSPLPDLADSGIDEVLASVHRPILAAMARRGEPFRGFLYAGLMLTVDGPVLLECNVRMGDPEAQVLMPRLSGPLGPWLLAAARGALDDDAGRLTRLPTFPGAAVGVVLAAPGYPDRPELGLPIDGLETAARTGALVFHAGTARRDGGGYGVNGGRVLTVVGRGPELVSARAAAERAAEAISWPGLQRRHDIGSWSDATGDRLGEPAGAAR